MSANDVIARLRELRAKATAGRLLALPDNPKSDKVWRVSDGEDFVCQLFSGHGEFENAKANAAAIVAAMNSLESLLACAAQLEKLTEAASCIRHWHDAMADGSGMVVSAEHVRKLWDATEQARRALQALAGGGGE